MAARQKPRILKLDEWLAPYEAAIDARMARYAAAKERLTGGASLTEFANGHLYFGIHPQNGGWVYREWAPAADEMHVFGEFNDWNRMSHPMRRLEGGVWEAAIPNGLAPGQRMLVEVRSGGRTFDRVPAWIRQARQNPETNQFEGVVSDFTPFPWTDGKRAKNMPETPFIYEAHVGMAREAGGIGSYDEFADEVLPRVKRAGYNCVQLMAVMEHAYYASFGYQVTSPFAASAWYGEPNGFKRLVDRAHSLGLRVLLDIVHAHMSDNARDGIADFDGSGCQYAAGRHPAWGTALYDYGKPEVLHYLLSNVKFWMEEYHIDGFRFDGVTSMLYNDHGLGRAFTSYADYFGDNANEDAAVYLTLASELIHELNPGAAAIAEDMSGMPGMCLPTRWGGLGFDYRLNMGVPDFWIKTVKQKRDADWDMGKLYHELTTRRPSEKTIGYAESHDQALVGDQTLLFRLMGAEMYDGMDKAYASPSAERAMALIKLIKLVTLSLGGEGWLSFMGNEFGHPEWIDFPREGNGWSTLYARRQWSLADNPFLKYEWLARFDREMLAFAKRARLTRARGARPLIVDQARKLIAFEKAGFAFVFNFHESASYAGLELPGVSGDLRRAFDTDRKEYGGQERVAEDAFCPRDGGTARVYSPARTAAAYQIGSESDSR